MLTVPIDQCEKYFQNSREHFLYWMKIADAILMLAIRSSIAEDISKDNQDLSNCELIPDLTDDRKCICSMLQSLKVMENESESNNVFLPISFLFQRFAFSPTEKIGFILGVCAASSQKYQKIFSLLQGNSSTGPSLELCQKLIHILQIGSMDECIYNLLGYQDDIKYLIFGLGSNVNRNKNWINKIIEIDSRILAFINEVSFVSPTLEDCLLIEYPYDDTEDELYTKVDASVDSLIEKYLVNLKKQTDSVMSILVLKGAQGCGKITKVKSIAKRYSKMILFIDYNKFIDCDKSDLIPKIQYLILEACLTDGIICFTGLTIDSKYKDSMEILLSKLYEYIKFFILTTDELDQRLLSFQSKRYIFTEITFLELTQAQRLEYWLKVTAGQNLLQEELEKISRGFLLTKGKINNIVRAFEFSKSGDCDTDTEMLKNMCIDNSIYDFGFLATRVKKAFNWDDIILGENCKNRLVDICNRVKYKDKVYNQWGFKEKSPYGNGISMLFYGPPGTGKTMAAQVMAKQIGCELYKVDLSQIVDKYIGETEKNLKKIFDNANRANVMLFFDEADSIFSKRTQVSNANDKYANVETSYLLQKMEEYEGICILATNFLVSFDDAFKRRIKFMVNFPMPDEKERLVIWQKAFPSGIKLSPDIQLQRLAEKYELTGSSIKSIVISSAFYAAANNEEISMKHIFLALKDELEKDGKVIIKREFDMY